MRRVALLLPVALTACAGISGLSDYEVNDGTLGGTSVRLKSGSSGDSSSGDSSSGE